MGNDIRDMYGNKFCADWVVVVINIVFHIVVLFFVYVMWLGAINAD